MLEIIRHSSPWWDFRRYSNWVEIHDVITNHYVMSTVKKNRISLNSRSEGSFKLFIDVSDGCWRRNMLVTTIKYCRQFWLFWSPTLSFCIVIVTNFNSPTSLSPCSFYVRNIPQKCLFLWFAWTSNFSKKYQYKSQFQLNFVVFILKLV